MCVSAVGTVTGFPHCDSVCYLSASFGERIINKGRTLRCAGLNVCALFNLLCAFKLLHVRVFSCVCVRWSFDSSHVRWRQLAVGKCGFGYRLEQRPISPTAGGFGSALLMAVWGSGQVGVLTCGSGAAGWSLRILEPT